MPCSVSYAAVGTTAAFILNGHPVMKGFVITFTNLDMFVTIFGTVGLEQY